MAYQSTAATLSRDGQISSPQYSGIGMPMYSDFQSLDVSFRVFVKCEATHQHIVKTRSIWQKSSWSNRGGAACNEHEMALFNCAQKI